jgi:hypothetical protein
MAPITLTKKLNLALPVETERGKIWVHSTPVSREIFEANYMLLVKTLAFMYANGVGPSFAPRVARLAIKDVAKEMDEEKDVSVDFLQEVYRLTNVLMPVEGGGWNTIPYYEVKSKKLIDEQAIGEVENAIIYFILASAIHLRSELPMAYISLQSTWKAQTTPLTVTEFGSSLMTSTTPVSTGEKKPVQMVPKASSVPS